MSGRPLIGILDHPRWDEKRGTLRENDQTAGIRRMVEIAQSLGADAFVFSLADVDLKARRVRGFTWRDGRWAEQTYRFPDVIYDQLVSRKMELSGPFQDTRRALSSEYGDRFFNDGFFDKWQIYEWLRRSPVRAHVPETVRHRSLRQGADFLARHRVAFLKPLHGSLGLGIVRFTMEKDGSVAYEWKRSRDGMTRGTAPSPADAVQMFRTQLRRRPYIWQQGIDLIALDGRPVDIRILLQRDGTGAWKRTKTFARVAKSGDFTSNLTTGGGAMPVDRAVLSGFPDDVKKRVRASIRRLAEKVAEAVEAGAGRTFGELGIDLGVDRRGFVWVIEVNSKPRKAPASASGRDDLVELSFRRPMEYALFLTRRQS
ncbi:YheC/YheD family endospore coat-associated protein [Alicyclobacillus vulcanalis]|uniref:YheC/YheD family endospore coat-associated protein n=1 Tax=Alicyclobacillus vulcanalis TaxID=252246 RepID=UPI00097059D2|nr:YheC/YheD family protein [Alicyclobacillus vulcanalis]